VANADNQPDLLHVKAEWEESVAANVAELHVAIRGTTFIVGNAALQKAREVKELVEIVRAIGLEEQDIVLDSVNASSATGNLLAQSTSATYSLRLRCRNLERMPLVLGAIAAQKHATLGLIAWEYPDTEVDRIGRLARATAIARGRAERIAAELGMRITGLHKCDASLTEPDEDGCFRETVRTRSRAARVQELDLGVAITHTGSFGATVACAFRVEPLGPESPKTKEN
jgi:hypothetical protein